MGRLYISDKMRNIKPYVVDKTQYEVKLDANESFIALPKEVEAEMKDELIRVLYNRYPDPDADIICRLYGEYCGMSSNNIMAGNGSDELIQILVNGFLDKGDTLLTIKPDFSMYKFYAALMGVNVEEYDMGEELIFDKYEFVSKAQSIRAKLIIFSNPNNPTGAVICRDDILYVVENTDALVIVDEAYFEFYGETVINEICKFSNMAVLRTCSKAIGIAAARVGFLIASEEVIVNLKKVKPPFNVSSLSQAAASVILKNKHIIDENIQKIKEGRDNLYSALKLAEKHYGTELIMVYPTYANFIYIKSPISRQIFEALKEMSIIVRCFGNFLRINTGSKEENQRFISALERIAATISKASI